ncbi:MAG: calpastatin [Ramlibacter sp.]|nr:calpastatin [Ramlibacter sp.]
MSDLDRFVQAQAPVIDAVFAELLDGDKRSHWMWFVFPQIQGLGRSAMAARYAISSLDEARAYLAHPVLGARLRQCCELVLEVRDRSAHEIFGSPDDLKFRSSLTLFDRAAGAEDLFRRCLDRFFGGKPDPQTLARL